MVWVGLGTDVQLPLPFYPCAFRISTSVLENRNIIVSTAVLRL